ncbi:MAG: hypothetical protein MI922_15565 [Bacteroidales bacterium]|nr:hypothetical protein [Bacteroidales bacterium]
MKNLKIYIAFLSALFIAPMVMANKGNDDVVFKALNDEMKRSMSQLQYEDYKKPFYIGYSLTTSHYSRIKASLGTLINSDDRHRNSGGVNLKVGDYQLNDEKFNDKANKVRHHDGYSTIPKNLDYDGIRRSYWLMTNNTYKNASEKYKNKKMVMTQHGMSEESMKCPDFSKEESVIKLIEALPDEKTQQELENFTRELSMKFKGASFLINSEVELGYQNNLYYFINSEGSKIKIPFRFYVVKVTASAFSGKNKPFEQKLEYYANSYSDLPSMTDIKGDIQSLILNMKDCAEAPVFDDTYYGPVLFTDHSVPELLFKRIFERGEGLIASPRSLVNDAKKGLQVSTMKSWDDLKEKKVIDRRLSIHLEPYLDTYNDVKLIGNHQLDLEAVKPKEKVNLVEAGILKEQINGRVPTITQHNSNGHLRFYVSERGIRKKTGPSVVKVTSALKNTPKELQAKMKELAEEEYLDHVFVVRTLKTKANYAPVNYYKLNLESGEEQLVFSVNFKFEKTKLMKVKGVGDKEVVHNTIVPDYKDIAAMRKKYERYPEEYRAMVMRDMGTQGTPSTLICPNAILFESVELSGVRNQIKAKKRVVPNPLAAK